MLEHLQPKDKISLVPHISIFLEHHLLPRFMRRSPNASRHGGCPVCAQRPGLMSVPSYCAPPGSSFSLQPSCWFPAMKDRAISFQDSPPPHFSLLWGESLSLLRAKKWGEEQNQEDAGFVSLENWRWKKRFWCTFESCEHGSLSSSPLTLICKQGGITSSSPFWLEPVLVGGIN